jgi:predicted MFS family arabinose efflux permease
MAAPLPAQERNVVLIVALVQFVNIVDFMMVMPLGPDFAKELNVPTSMIGIVGGSYTLAAALAGIVGSFFLDKLERKRALAGLIVGLGAATALGGLSIDLTTLVAARVLAGVFGGPATSMALAIVSDVVPPERRGKAIGLVSSAFAVASVLGVPAGLELSRRLSFRAPFFVVGALAVVIAIAALALLPSLRGHLTAKQEGPKKPFLTPTALLALSVNALVMLGVFMVVPNITAFVQFNLGYPRAQLGLLYLVGGLLSFVAVRLIGMFVDRYGAFRAFTLGTAIHLTVLVIGFISPVAAIPLLVTFPLFMVSGGTRMVPMQTLASRIPAPEARARYMSAQSAVQHTASAAGAFLGSAFLHAEPSGRLIGMEALAIVAFVLAALAPFFVGSVERSLARRAAPAS